MNDTGASTSAELLLQSVTDHAIYMLDPWGFIHSWNPGAERLKRYRADEVLGQHISMFYTEKDRAAHLYPIVGSATRPCRNPSHLSPDIVMWRLFGLAVCPAVASASMR
jgi:hypothetical protein